MKKLKDGTAIWLFASVFTLVLIIAGIVWGVRDANFAVSFWGSALGTALGGMAAVVAALSVWTRQSKQAISLSKRERTLRAGREVYARVAEIRSLASAGEIAPMGKISEQNLELIRQQRSATIPEIAGVEDEELRAFLQNAVRYLTTNNDEMAKLDEVHPYVLRAMAVTQAISQAVADYRDESSVPFEGISCSSKYDAALLQVAEARDADHTALHAELAALGLGPDVAK
jgi:hypothetical protein